MTPAGGRDRKLRQDARARVEPAEDARPAVDGGEQLLVPGHVLGVAQKQEAVGQKREVEEGDDPVLQVGVEIDQQVAAGDQVELREGRVPDDVVRREDAHLAQFLGDDVGVALLVEPAREPLRRDVGGDRRRVAPDPRRRERPRVDVGGEDLHMGDGVAAGHLLAQQHGDAVGLLAGRAAEHPHAHDVARPLAVQELRDHLPLQNLELPGVAEELRHADQEVVEEVLHFVRVGAQMRDVAFHVVNLDDLRPALDPAQEGVRLVAVEVVPGLAAQNGRDLSERAGRLGDLILERLALPQPGEVLRVGREALRDLRDRKQGVGERPRRVAGGEFRRALVRLPFGDREPAAFLEGRDAERPVARRAVEHHPGRALALIVREGDQEAVDRAALSGPLGLAQLEAAVLQGQDRVGRREVEAAAFDGRAMLDRRERGGQRLKAARLHGLLVLKHDHDGPVRRGLKRFQKTLQGFGRGGGRREGDHQGRGRRLRSPASRARRLRVVVRGVGHGWNVCCGRPSS
jgi:hypothetical protein